MPMAALEIETSSSLGEEEEEENCGKKSFGSVFEIDTSVKMTIDRKADWSNASVWLVRFGQLINFLTNLSIPRFFYLPLFPHKRNGRNQG